jgi:Tol biopolymer transport system component
VDALGGWPDSVAALDDPIGSVGWSPAGEQLAFTLAPGGGMNVQVYTVKPDGTHLRGLTAGGKATNDLGGWTHDGGKLMVASNRRTPASLRRGPRAHFRPLRLGVARPATVTAAPRSGR